jgi:hypothetical protein
MDARLIGLDINTEDLSQYFHPTRDDEGIAWV